MKLQLFYRAPLRTLISASAVVAAITMSSALPAHATGPVMRASNIALTSADEPIENEDPLVTGDYDEDDAWESYADDSFELEPAGSDAVTGLAPLTGEAYIAALPSTKVATWRDGLGVSTFMRQGTWSTTTKKGFGWAKIKAKHGIKKYQTVKHPTGNPDKVFKGTKVEYVAYATKWVNKRPVAQIPVITVVENGYWKNYYGVGIKGSPGVLTTYCVLPNKATKCPSWVDTAFTKANNGHVFSAPLAGTSPTDPPIDYDWSYDPIGE